jgi:hypothetical protein
MHKVSLPVPSSYWELSGNQVSPDSIRSAGAFADKKELLCSDNRKLLFEIWHHLKGIKRNNNDSAEINYIGYIAHENGVITRLFEFQSEHTLFYNWKYIIGVNSKQENIKSVLFLNNTKDIMFFGFPRNAVYTFYTGYNKFVVYNNSHPSDITFSEDAINQMSKSQKRKYLDKLRCVIKVKENGMLVENAK